MEVSKQTGRWHQGVFASARAALWFLVAAALLWGQRSVVVAAGPSLFMSSFRIDQWKSEQGLPQNTVRSLLQTRDGYLWIATRGGLARFDGWRFTVFHRGNTPEMADDNCVGLVEDGDGALWIGTKNGLLRWQDHRFTAWRAGSTNSPAALAHDQIRALCPSRDGGVWIGTANGLDLFRDGAFTHCTTADGLQANNIRAVLEDSRGSVWVGTEMHQYFGGLQRRDPAGKQFVTVAGQGTNLPFMVHGFLEDKAGHVGVGRIKSCHIGLRHCRGSLH